MTDEKQLSLCVVTKNDEAFLPACLDEMKEVADEMLVADLGSEDRTAELAERVGATVYRPRWEDNFSKMKNFCMERAAGKWVLFLQADEAIPHEQLKELKFILKNPNAEGYLIYSGYAPEERNVSSPTQFLRLIRNRKEYCFLYRSFEYIPEEVLYSVCDSHLCITHRGEKTVGWQLKERIRLLQKDIKEHPRDSYVSYLEGIELMDRGKYGESAVPFELARRTIGGGTLYAPHLYKCLGISLLYLARYGEAEKILSEGYTLFPFYRDLLVLRAETYRRLGRDRDALEDLEACISLGKMPNPYVPGPEINDSVIQEMLEEIHGGLQKGDR